MSSFKNFGLHLKNNSISPVSITGHLGIFANGDQVSIVNFQSSMRDIRVRDMISDTAHVSGASFLAGTVNALSNVVVSGNGAISGSSYFKGNLNALSDLIVTGNEAISGSLKVVGDTRVGNILVTGNGAISGSLKVNSLTLSSASPYSLPTTKGLEGTVIGVSGGNVQFISLSNYALTSSLPAVTGSCLTVNSTAISGNWLIGSDLTVNNNSLLKGNVNISGSLNVTGNEVIFGNATISGSTLTSNLKTGDLLVTGNTNISGSLTLASNLDTKGTLGFRGYNVVATSGTFLVTPDMLGKIIHLTGPSNILLPQSLNFNGDHYSFKAATNQASVISGGSYLIDTLATIGLSGLSFKEVYFYGSNWFTK
jgi:hypothetical protein